ncbi:MAG: CoA-binding protein [Chloroflexi bacterium]|nr:CoA-binding protein [Chloroflexota bacterium]
MLRKLNDAIFNPGSVAVTGVSTSYNYGQAFVECLLKSGFSGTIYPINPKGGEIMGLRAYASIRDVPGPVDYVISCSPSSVAPQLVSDCASLGVKVISLFTAGFSEAGTREGRELEQQVLRAAQNSQLRILGPNCLGLYSPRLGISFASDLPGDQGRIAYIAQSGGNAIQLIRAAGRRGVRFSKAVSYGNAIDVDESELLEYLTSDDETDVVAAYIEGVRDGRRFLGALKQLAAIKPVVVVKGGHTAPGAAAAASHTGALSGSGGLWDVLLEQAGAIRAHDLEELADMLVTFTYMKVPEGKRVAVCGAGGGFTVLATDQYVEAGFVLPSLTARKRCELDREIRNFVPSDAGMLLKNPFDLMNLQSFDGLYAVLRRLAANEDFDLLATHFSVEGWPGTNPPHVWQDLFIEALVRVRSETGKPMAVAVHGAFSGIDQGNAARSQRKCWEAGLPVYHNTASAARALGRFVRYHEKRARQPWASMEQ